MSLRSAVKQILTGYMDRQYKFCLSKRRLGYTQWIEHWDEHWDRKEMDQEDEPWAASDIFLFYSSHGKLAEGTRNRIAGYFRQHPEVAIVYGDEDVWDTGIRRMPWFKPDWSPDTFLSYFYFGSVVAVRKELLVKTKLNFLKDNFEDNSVGQNKEFIVEKSFDHVEEILPMICKSVAAAGGFTRGGHGIGHIKGILFHCDGEEVLRSYGSVCPGKCLAKDIHHIGQARLSVIIPSRDNPDLLMKAVDSVLKQRTGPEAILQEIIIVDNGSSGENRGCIQAYINRINKNTDVIYLYQPMEFHFSRMCNMGAEAAHGNVFLFLNDDVELAWEGTFVHMAELAMRPYTGAVGLKLYYPGTRTIQHAGITNLPVGPVHKLQFLSDGEEYDFLRNRVDYNVLAVTGACLMTAEHKFNEAGGFADELPVAFNDVDLCFRLYELGYVNVSVNGEWAYHHESVSRGEDETPEKLARLMGERQKLYERHPGLEGTDPYFAEGLEREVLDTRIRPAWVTSGNRRQEGTPERFSGDLKRCREDKCLLVRIEYCGIDGIQGYSVVLGDDNACYRMELILKGSQGIYSLPLVPQYRPDLEENMADQKNVALSGFLVSFKAGGLPLGEYRVGMLAVNRVSGLRLVNWSNRYLHCG